MNDLDAIRAATRELHELVQEAKDVRAGLAYDIAAIKGQVQEVVAAEVKRTLGELGETTKAAIDKTAEAPLRRDSASTPSKMSVMVSKRWYTKPSLAEFAELMSEKFAELMSERAHASETPVPTPEPEEVVDALRADAPAE